MHKKYLLLIPFISIGFAMLSPAPLLASGFASWAKIDPNSLSGKLSIAMRSQLKHIPSEKELGTPVYPGAKITGYSPPGGYLGRKRKDILPAFTLVSTSEKSKVIDFYQKHLKDYKHLTTNPPTFVKFKGKLKPREFNPDKDGSEKVGKLNGLYGKLARYPHVTILSPGSSLSKAVPGVKTLIEMSYSARKKRTF